VMLLGASSLVGVLSLSSLMGGGASGSVPEAVPQGLGTFTSVSQLQSFIAANAGSAQRYYSTGVVFGGPEFVPGGLLAGVNGNIALAASLGYTPSATSYTTTNVQVQGVDEPDRVKTDGTCLFVSTDHAVAVIAAYPPNATAVISTLSYKATFTVLGLEEAQGRLLVFAQSSVNGSSVELLLYDTSVPSSPSLMANLTVPGSYVAARLSQGYAYAVVQQPSYEFPSAGNATPVMPEVAFDGATLTLPPSSVYYTQNRAQISYYTVVVSMSMSTGKYQTISVLTGPSSTVYVSASNIYVVYTDYQQFYADGIPGDIYTGGVFSPSDLQQGANSTIFRASYSNGTVSVEAAGSVPGTVLNQFSLDEYSGYLRIATSRFAEMGGSYTTSDDVYVLSLNMSQVSALRNIAPGENIYAVSFVGQLGYVVTYEQVDPLFAISFANPANPVILSALKVSGYSDYLYPLQGGYLIGVGKDTVPASDGNYSYYLGLKVSLFHVSANGPSEQVSELLIGDRGTDSPVLTDHLAFTFDPSLNVTVIPVLLAKVGGNQSTYPGGPPPFGDYVWQGVYVIKVTPEGLTVLGNVTQYAGSQGYGDSADSGLQIDRSVVIGGFLYTVSQAEVMVTSLSSFSTVATVQLPS